LCLRDLGETEVGGFGITAADDLLYVDDILLVRQVCSSVSVLFDDSSVADFFDRQVDAGRRPEQVGRVWVHTHPGSCPNPSGTDEDTFARVFGRTEWAVMFIVARGGQTYARMEFHVGPGGSLLLPVEVDFRHPFPGSNLAAWQEEYLANVQPEELLPAVHDALVLEPLVERFSLDAGRDSRYDLWDDLLEEELVGIHLRNQESGVRDEQH
jgi:proteasome lid subunit RPN8/RPN11